MEGVLLILLIAGVLECSNGRVPCVDDCPPLKRPVCTLDQRDGARVFDNLCLMDSFNLCYSTEYTPQPELTDCKEAYDEEYSRESKIPYKNPNVIELYQNKIDNLYL